MKKILIVEDDPNLGKATKIRLDAAGYETMLAVDAIQGVAYAKDFRPNVVLLDITMPCGDGLLVAERIRMLPGIHPEIIFLTASKEPSLRSKAETFMPLAYIEKPYEFNVLLDQISTNPKAE